jgi:hypothetical protein
LASEWVSSSPQSSEAKEALALALWLLGNSTAADSMAAARKLARHPRDRLRIGLTEALLRLLSDPAGVDNADLAGRLADSLLAHEAHEAGTDPRDAATLAALTGRIHLAAQYERTPRLSLAQRLPPQVASDALQMLTIAAAGLYPDSLAALEIRVDRGLQNFTGADLDRERMEWLGRPAALAYPIHPFRALPALGLLGDYLLTAQVAHLSGDTARTRRLLREAQQSRRLFRPSDISLESLVPEALMLQSLGDLRGAVTLLDPKLESLHEASLRPLLQPVGAAVLLRAMVLRSDLALALADSAGAARWAEPVIRLWSGRDQAFDATFRQLNKRMAWTGRQHRGR